MIRFFKNVLHQSASSGALGHTGQAPVSSFIKLPDDENVRRYTVEANKKSKRPTDVHNAIRDTFTNRSSIFSLLNNGITLVAKNVAFLDKKTNTLELNKPSIINGSQTRGVIRDILNADNGNSDKNEIKVKFEILGCA